MALNRKQIENDIKNCLNSLKSLEGKMGALLRHTKGLLCYDNLVQFNKEIGNMKTSLSKMELIDKKTKEPLK